MVYKFKPDTKTDDKNDAHARNVKEKQEFWVDSNGRQMIRRVQDERFSFDLEDGASIEPVASNYYPMTAG